MAEDTFPVGRTAHGYSDNKANLVQLELELGLSLAKSDYIASSAQLNWS